MTTSRRAPALAPEERRKAIVAAAIPLLELHGTAVTTKQIADAAGIAEGTVFRAFPDKDTLLREALTAAFDPAPTLSELAAIDPALPLETRAVAVVSALQRRIGRILRLITVVWADTYAADSLPRPDFTDDPIAAAIEATLAADAERLRFNVQFTARTLRLFTVACTHPRLGLDEPMPAELIVDLVLHGCLTSTAPPHSPATPTPGSAPAPGSEATLSPATPQSPGASQCW